MVLALTSQKGGVGKSTLAYNLATLFARDGISVCLADSDDNQTCLRWFGFRLESTEKIPMVRANATPDETMKSQIKSLRQQYELIILDGMPSLGKVNTKILYASDYVLIPLQSSGPDAGTINTFHQRIKEAQDDRDIPLVTGVVLNRYDPRIGIDKALREHLRNHPLQLFPQVICQRAIYKESYFRGLGINEIYDEKGKLKNPKAVEELESFYQELLTRLRAMPEGEFLNRFKSQTRHL